MSDAPKRLTRTHQTGDLIYQVEYLLLSEHERIVAELREGWRQSILQREANVLPETEAAVHISELEEERDVARRALELSQQSLRAADAENERLRERVSALEGELLTASMAYTAADDRADRLRARVAELEAAGEKVLEGFGLGLFVRNTEMDDVNDWALRLFPHLSALARLVRNKP